MSVARRALADGLGTALLLAVVVGSGIMGERLAGGNDALALLANALATGFGLVALILAFGPRSGAHFNPLVTAVLALRREFPLREVLPYLAAQLAGALAGVLADYDRVLRQRNSLLKSARASGLRESQLTTLEIWDERLVGLGSEIVDARVELVARLGDPIAAAYRSVAGDDHHPRAIREDHRAREQDRGDHGHRREQRQRGPPQGELKLRASAA